MIGNVTYLRQLGNLPDDLAEALLSPHLEAAGDELCLWVGEEAYADAASQAPSDQLRARRLKRAEAHLALARAFPSLTGNVKPGQGFVGGASLTEGQASYLTPSQVQELVKQHLAQAEREAGPYLLPAKPYVGVVSGDA